MKEFVNEELMNEWTPYSASTIQHCICLCGIYRFKKMQVWTYECPEVHGMAKGNRFLAVD